MAKPPGGENLTAENGKNNRIKVTPLKRKLTMKSQIG